MSWFNVWDGLKTKTCRYLLQRYLGQFFESKLNLEQLKVDLYNGRAVVHNVLLKVEAINDLFESQGWGVEVVSGRIGCLTVDVPWNALMTNDSSVEVSDLYITVRPVKRKPTGTSMLESMWSSVSSSIQMAEECMKQSDDDIPFETHTNSIAGLEKFAETIDNVLNRIHAKFSETVIVIEHKLPNFEKNLVLIIKINDIDYKNETGMQSKRNIQTEQAMSKSSEENDLKTNVNLMPSIANHNLILNNVTVYTGEYTVTNRNRNEDSYCYLNQFAGFFKPRVVPIVELKGSQKVQIKTKQTETVDGPKVCLEIEIGKIYIMLTPRYVHQLVKIINSFNEKISDQSALIKLAQHKKRAYSMQTEEKTMMSGIINSSGNWCTGDDYVSVSKENVMRRRIFQDNYRMDGSLSSSFSTSNTVTTKFNQRMSSLETSGEILRFKIQIASITAVALHKDILKSAHEKDYESSLSLLVNLATSFFSKITEDPINYDLKDCNDFSEKDYLYLQLSPIFINGNQQRNQQILTSKTEMTVTKVDLEEVLDKKTTYIILFDRKGNCSEGYHKRPELSIAFKSSFSCAAGNCVSNTVNITLEKCTIEFDISIYDRLSAVFGASPFFDYQSLDQLYLENEPPKSNLELTVSAALCQIHIRFPIVDARKQNDPEKVPWWKQNIREDFIILTLLSTIFTWDPNKMSITSNQIDGYYCDGNIENVVDILKSESDIENMEENHLPKITIEMNSKINDVNNFSAENRQNNEDASTPNKSINSPFSAKHVWRQSDAAHGLCGEIDSEDSFLPGETDELNIFCERAKNTSKIKITVHLPVASVVLESKQLYEIIYNRLNSDLFMWEPTSPYFHSKADIKQNAQSAMLLKSQEQFFDIPMYDNKYCENKYMLGSYFETSCSSTGMNDSSDAIKSDDSIYQSANEKIMRSNIGTKSITSYKASSACAVEIILDQAALSLFVPVRDVEAHVLPGQTGKFNLQANNLRIFSVTGYDNNENMNYVCLQLNEVEVYHCGLVPSNKPFTLFANQFEICDFMESTFYNIPNTSEEIQSTLLDKRREVVSLVIEIKKVPQERIKRLRITTGISKAILRHNPTTPSYTWLNQLIDFLDVTDFPIEGYYPYAVITEMQIHLWDCIVDYRPNNFPYRALVDIGFFTISSNVISSINGCNLRFIAEECALSLAPYKHCSKTFPKNQICFPDRKSLVTVLQIGLFDISLRLSEQTLEHMTPKIDLRCSIQDVHLRTCSDSAKAFAQLIAHIANDGLIIENDDDHDVADQLKIPSSDNIVGNTISENMSSSITMANREQQHVKMMVAEALQDEFEVLAKKTAKQKKESSEKGFELFYFPDEGAKLPIGETTESHVDTVHNYDLENFETNVILNSYYAQAKDEMCSQVKSELGNIYVDIHNTSGSSDDFCIIQESEKMFLNQCGVKQISLSEDPLRIVDNHFFLPQDKPDLLRTPPNFPVPEYRYTLCEMTFVWHLFGGNDFSEDQNIDIHKTKKSAPMMSDTYKYGVSQPKVNASANTSKAHVKNARSGPRRNLDVLVELQFTKIRFSHEIYPMLSTHASRQVLLISEFEIRDRLRSSDINKFLYHPTAKSLANRTNENMVVIKALHMRPNPKKSSAEECSLRISILPIKLNIDQDTLLFLEAYFANLSNNPLDEATHGQNEPSRSGTTKLPTEPVLAVDELPEALKDLKARNMVSKNLDILIDEQPKGAIEIDITETPNVTCPIYFREVIFSPALPICLDYQGRRIELSRGPVAGFLLGLAQLQGSGICLREIENRRGLLGWNKLFTYLCKQWLKDIKRNQLPKILSGLGPTNAVLQLFQGIYDLFWLPIEQYQKDGRVIRGFQLGAQSFSARTALAALEITSRIIHLLQFTAETTFDMLSAGPSVRRRRIRQGKKRLSRPKDMREGFTNAYMIVKDGINSSANNLIETAIVEHDQKGYTGAVGAVVRQIPQLVVCPAVLATQATTNILGGAKSSLVPDAKLEARDKWKEEAN